MNSQLKEARLEAGTIRYRDAGAGQPVVFVHGLVVNGQLWRKVTPKLEARFRCIVPDWPLGSHGVPMQPNADLSPPGIARLIAEFLELLGLEDVTLVANDSGGALSQLLVTHHPKRVGRLVLTNCDCFEQFLPWQFRYFQWAGHFPWALATMGQAMRWRPLRQLPFAYGRLSKSPIPAPVLDAYCRAALEHPGVRRDLGKVLRGISNRYTLEVAEQLHTFQKPVLLAWAAEDIFFRLEHARKLAERFPDAQLKVIEEAWTFVPEDQPEALAALIEAFIQGSILDTQPVSIHA